MADCPSSCSRTTAATTFVLDLTDTNLFTWRVRAKPFIDADEIDVLHHGDRITAGRDAMHVGWLKLVSDSGWVKEAHDQKPVWNLASTLDHELLAASTCSQSVSFASSTIGVKSSEPTKAAKELSPENVATSAAGSSGYQSLSPTPNQQALKALLPIPFTGKAHQLLISERELATTPSTTNRWFTGQGQKLASLSDEEAFVSSSIQLKKLRWADVEDSDDEEAKTTLSHEDDKHTVSQIYLHDARERVGIRTASSDGEDRLDSRRSRRKQRNQDLLRRAAKTVLCKYASQDDLCPFGNLCWFRHGEAVNSPRPNDPLRETQKASVAQVLDIIAPPRISNQACQTDSVVRNPHKLERNTNLRKRKQKTQMCQHFISEKYCSFGDSCWFAHAADELRPS